MQRELALTPGCRDYVKVAKERVSVVEKPFSRAAEGTPKESDMLKLYANRLDEIYQKGDSDADAGGPSNFV
jgi:hypothetical protein